MSRRQRPDSQRVPGWTTDTELIREFHRPADVTDAVVSTVGEAVEEWPELSETPPLYHFVDAERLDGLFKTRATDDSGWLPSTAFQFQGCRVTVLYGPTIRVIMERDP
jgi:hypothetical protein